MEELWNIFPAHLRDFIKEGFRQPERPEEIRMRIGRPAMLDIGSRELFWDKHACRLMETADGAYTVTEKDLKEIVLKMSRYSMYAFEEELRAGFLTIQGGHRIGIAGKAVCENGSIKTIRQISFLNIRIAGEKKGCADAVLPYLRCGGSIYNTLIISPPGAGKTTMLRDCIRQLSEGDSTSLGLKVGVVDERSEIAACYLGQPQNDLGPRTDVMDCCPKSEGMLMLLRSMSPQVIGVDELGGQADYEAVEYALHCGCRILGTMHGDHMEEMKQKPHLSRWLGEQFFERYLLIHKDGQKERHIMIFDEGQKLLYDSACSKQISGHRQNPASDGRQGELC